MLSVGFKCDKCFILVALVFRFHLLLASTVSSVTSTTCLPSLTTSCLLTPSISCPLNTSCNSSLCMSKPAQSPLNCPMSLPKTLSNTFVTVNSSLILYFCGSGLIYSFFHFLQFISSGKIEFSTSL